MPVDQKASVRISAFRWVPPFAQGHIRDLRVRWALLEAEVSYGVRKLDATTERPADYFEEQPCGRVPSYRDDTVSLFESGAIVLHIGHGWERLLPTNAAARARATAWLIAKPLQQHGRPFVMQLATIDIFCSGEEWAKQRRPGVVEMISKRLSRLSEALGDEPFLDGDTFTAGDLMMTSVLRSSTKARTCLSAIPKGRLIRYTVLGQHQIDSDRPHLGHAAFVCSGSHSN